MTTERQRELNRAAQRRRRSSERAREIDREYMRRKRAEPGVLEKQKWDAVAERRNPETWARSILRPVKHRAKLRGLEFTLTPDDISLPEVCPVLGIPLVIGARSEVGAGESSPSLDRLDSSRGYTPDNVRVISMRANVLKQDATVAELEAVLAYMKREGCP